MKKQNVYQFLLIASILLIGCNDKKSIENQVDSSQTTKVKTIESDSILLDNVTSFSVSEDEEIYSASDFKLRYHPDENFFVVTKNNDSIGKVDFDNQPFDGVGYNVYQYESKKTENKVLVFEALADIGTAWYYLALLDNESVIKTFFVHEPLANSDEVGLNDFLHISLKEKKCCLKFNKKLVAKYSTIPNEAKTDTNFIYLTK